MRGIVDVSVVRSVEPSRTPSPLNGSLFPPLYFLSAKRSCHTSRIGLATNTEE